MLTMLVGTALLALIGAAPAAADATTVDPALLSALRAGDWTAVSRIAGARPDPAVEVAYLAGHASLRLDDPNAALCLFFFSFDEPRRARWLEWTRRFAADSGDSAVGQYLLGDALARLSRWDEALAAFDRSLTLAPDDPLALDAQAAALAGAGRFEAAEAAAVRATEAAGAVADAFATRATLALMAGSAAPGAARWAREALARVPSFAIARNTLGVARAALGSYDDAERDFAQARDAGPCALMTTANLTALAGLRMERESIVVAAAEGVPGAVIDARSGPARQAMLDAMSHNLHNLSDAHKQAIGWGLGADLARSVKNLLPHPVARLAFEPVIDTFRGRQQQQLDRASQLETNSLRLQLDATRMSIVRDPDGPAAQAWRARGVDPQHLTIDHLRHPPTVPGGADTSAATTHRDRGVRSLSAWLSLGYDVSWPAHREGSAG